jgi:putative transposase
MPPDPENRGLDRVGYQLRSSGLKHDPINPLRSGTHTRGYLPHVKREGADYFVTFRLADSLPREILLKYERERAERMSRLFEAKRAGRNSIDNELLIHRDFRRKVERYLDKGAGACHLGRLK